MSARWISVLAIAACGGCTLLLGYGDPSELRAADAGVDGAGDGAADGAVVGDGGADAEASAESSVPFCDSVTPRPTFCSSFDGPSYLAGWGSSDVANTRLERGTAFFTSAPAALHVSLDRKDDAGVLGEVGTDFAAFEGKPFTATLAFDVRVEAAAPEGALAVIANAMVIGAAGGPSFILQVVSRPLADGSVSLSLVEVTPSATSSDHRSSVPLTIGQWSRVAVTVTATTRAAGNTARVLVDGKVGFEGPLGMAFGAGVPGTSLGIATVDPGATAWALSYDNVTFDIR